MSTLIVLFYLSHPHNCQTFSQIQFKKLQRQWIFFESCIKFQNKELNYGSPHFFGYFSRLISLFKKGNGFIFIILMLSIIVVTNYWIHFNIELIFLLTILSKSMSSNFNFVQNFCTNCVLSVLISLVSFFSDLMFH